MSLGSPPAELDIVSPSFSCVTPRPPARIQADGGGASDGGEGDPDEFRKFSDQELQLKIVRMRGLSCKTHDGGERSRKFVRRVEKELHRRRTAGPSKVDTGRRLALHTPSRDDVFSFNSGDELNCSNFGVKRHQKSYFAPPTKNGKVESGQRQEVQTPSVDDPYAFMPQVENTSNHAPIIDNEATNGGLNPFASTNLEGLGATSTNLGADEVKPTTCTCSGQKGEETGKRVKQSQITVVLENNLEYKVKQTQKLVEEAKETAKQEDRFTIEKCVAVLEAIKELNDMEKAKVLKLLKCRLNREIFMTTKSASVRLIWLKSEIYA